jgi:hypothetical protein
MSTKYTIHKATAEEDKYEVGQTASKKPKKNAPKASRLPQQGSA